MRSVLPLAACLAAALVAAPSTSPAQQPPAAPATAPAKPAPSPAPTPAATASKVAAAPAAQPQRAPARKKKAKKVAPGTPIASYPGFRMLDGGGSRVLVSLTKKVSVTEHKAQGKLTYRIQGVQVPTRTNRLPLITTFFSTPVSRAELVERDGDVDLVIDLRAAATPQVRMIETDRGAELQVDFPKVEAEGASTPPAGAGAPKADPPAGRPAAAKKLDAKSETAY